MSPPADAHHEALWTIRAISAFAGAPRIDPYLVWADATRYRSFGRATVERIPIAIEMKEGALTAQAFAQRIEREQWQHWIGMSSLYRDAPSAFSSTRFCTAHVTHEFFAHIDAELSELIERFTLAAPLVRHTASAQSETLAAVPRRDDIGKVIVGVCDDGIAYGHRRFHESATGTSTRFQCFWNQSDAAGQANGLGYGSELLKSHIDTQLHERHRVARAASETNVYRMADRRKRVRDDHAPHESPLPLIGVQFGSAGRAAHDHAGLGRDVQVLDAVRYIVTRAQDTMGAASHALINLSCAHIAGPRDGSSLIECALDELMDTGACSIVIPVGSGHRSRGQGTLSLDDEAALRCRVVRDFASPGVVEIWFASNVRDPLVDVSMISPLGARSEWISVGNVARYARSDDDDALCMVVHGGRGARGDGHMILIAFTSPGDWLVRLRNRSKSPLHAMYSCARHTNVSRVTQPRA